MPPPSELVFYRGNFQENQPIAAEPQPLSEKAVGLLEQVKTAARLRYGERAAKDALEQPWTLVELPEGYGVDAICIFGSETATYEPKIETFGSSGLRIKFKHPEGSRFDQTVINILPHQDIRHSPYADTSHAYFKFVSESPDRGSQGGNLELMFSSTIENASQIVDDRKTTWSVQEGIIIGVTESLKKRLCTEYFPQDSNFHLPVNFLYITSASPQIPS